VLRKEGFNTLWEGSIQPHRRSLKKAGRRGSRPFNKIRRERGYGGVSFGKNGGRDSPCPDKAWTEEDKAKGTGKKISLLRGRVRGDASQRQP